MPQPLDSLTGDDLQRGALVRCLDAYAAERLTVARVEHIGMQPIVARVSGSHERDLYPALWRAVLPLFDAPSWREASLATHPSFEWQLDEAPIAARAIYRAATWRQDRDNEAMTLRCMARAWLCNERTGLRAVRDRFRLRAAHVSLSPDVHVLLLTHALTWLARAIPQAEPPCLIINAQHHLRASCANWREDFARILFDSSTLPAPRALIVSGSPTWRGSVTSRVLTRTFAAGV